MTELPIGMKYEEVRGKLKQYDPAKRNMLKESMCNQVKLAEGEGAATDLMNEVNHIGQSMTCSTNFINRKSMTVTGTCLKPCLNRNIKCFDCFKFSNYEKTEVNNVV